MRMTTTDDYCSSLVELLRYRASQNPDNTAYIFVSDNGDFKQTLSYGELDRLARCIAAKIQANSIPGERALLLYPPGLDFVTAFFGCLYAGLVAVPAYPPRDNANAERLHALAEDVQARLIFSTDSQKNAIERRLLENTQLGRFEVIASDILKDGEAMWRESFPNEHTLAFIQYTSGSSGKPKGVMVSHGNILHNEMLIQAAFGHTHESILVGWLPLFHDMGLIGNLLQPLYIGFPIVLFSPAAFIQKPLMWLQLISEYRANTSGGPNFAYEHCINRITDQQKAELDLSCWKVAFNGAEPVRAETLKRFSAAFSCCGFRKEAFYPCYGMAEATLFVSGGQIQTLPKTARLNSNGMQCEAGDDACVQEKVSCGFTWLDQKILIVDPQTLTPCMDGHVGEIWTSGSSIAQGYWNRPEETEKIFKAHLADSGEGPFLRTGDLGFIREGELYVTGRHKDLIIIRGRNHYPQDIEQTVEQSHSSLNPGGTAAFSVEVDREERLVVLQEVKRSSLRSVNTEEVCACVRRAILQKHEINVYAVVLLKTNSIPKTSSGKIQRHQCRARYISGELAMVGQWRIDSEPVASTCDTLKHDFSDRRTIENWLVSNISQKTNVAPAQINLREPLAAYGLDSMAVVTLSGELETWLGRKLSPTLVYDYPSVESLARYLAGETESIGAPASSGFLPEQANEPIAVIGMGCRFPGASNPEALWQLLVDGGDAVTTVPSSRWDRSRYLVAAGHGGFIDNIDLFDPLFFGISPREAECMDPQQRLLLEVAWEALENALIPPSQLAGTKTGVFIGISSHDYSNQQRGELSFYQGTGNAQSIAANRISYSFDLRGPSWSVDSACSSSLVAVHQACQSLRNGESDTVIAGGVNALLSPEISAIFSQAGMLAEDGRCKTFDASANGYVRGEGCGVVILKRLSDAQADGSPLLAVIRGSAINQDGRSNGLTAPNGLSQQAVIRAAHIDAGIHPGEIGYIEAHGTGTPLGDPIEYNSLAEVLAPRSSTAPPCMVGSIKTNMGHLEAAAGIAGFIKTVLMLRNGQIPPNLHLKELSPHLNADSLHLAIPRRLEPWVKGERPRMAGISSFGMGGTNAHVVVQEAPPTATSTEDAAAAAHLLLLSARDESALRMSAQRYELFLRPHEDLLPEICARAATGREHFEQRLAVTGRTAIELSQMLTGYLNGNSEVRFAAGRAPSPPPKVVFLFPGQGPQYVNMGRSLYEDEPVFRAAMDRCAEIADTLLTRPLLEVLYPRTGEVTPIDESAWTQPALFALGYSLVQLWRSWGVTPDAVLGHSLGEYLAACVAGVFSLEDGMRFVTERGRLMQSVPEGGAMISVQAGERILAERIRPWSHQISIAAINGPNDCVLSGLRSSLKPLTDQLAAEGYQVKELQISMGSHSPLMDILLEEFRKVAESITYSAPNIPLVANLTANISDEVASPAYWVRHLRQTVRYHEGVIELDRQGYTVFLEMGPKPTLLALAAPSLPPECVLLPSLQKGIQDKERMLRTLGELYANGVSVDWKAVYGEKAARSCPDLPNYPFQRKRHWRMEQTGRRGTVPGLFHPLLGRRIYSPLNPKEVIFEANFGTALPCWLDDHKVQENVLFPAAAFIEMLLAAAGSYFKTESVQLQDVTFISPLISPCEQERIVHTVIIPGGNRDASVSIYSFKNDGLDHLPDCTDWTLHVSGTISTLGDDEQSFEGFTPLSDSVVVENFYERCRSQGIDYGESFQGIRELRRSNDCAEGDLLLTDSTESEKKAYKVHPALLDAALQVAGGTLPDELANACWVPVALGRLSFCRTPGKNVVSRARLNPVIDPKSETVSFDLVMVENGDNCILRVEGLFLRRISLESPDLPTLMYETQWHLSPLHPLPYLAKPPKRWLILSDRGGVGEKLGSLLRQRGDFTTLVFAGESFGKVENGFLVNPSKPVDFLRLFQESWKDGPCYGIVHLWSIDCLIEDPDSAGVEAAVRLGCQGALYMLQGLLAQEYSGVHLSFVTRNAMPVKKGDPIELIQSPLWGLARVVHAEQPELGCCCIDLEAADVKEVEALFQEVTTPGNEKQIAYRDQMRYSERLSPSVLASFSKSAGIRRDSSYLITGGLGGIGLQVCRWLVDQGAGAIILTGRTASSDALDAGLKKAASGRTRIVAVSADVAHYDGMAGVLKDIEKSGYPLRGVIHAAGVLQDHLISQMPWRAFENVLTPKVHGAWNLHLLTRGMELDFFVCFSSAASLLGSPAQGNYAAANAFLDALCHYRRRLELPGVALNWGPWKEMGMIAATAANASIWKRLDAYGVDPITPKEGMEAFGLILGGAAAQVAVMHVRWSRFFQNVSSEKEPYFDIPATLENKKTVGGLQSFAQRMSGKTGDELYRFLLMFFRDAIAGILGLAQDELPIDRPLNTLGLDSLMIFELINRVKKETGLKLSLAEIMEGMTLQGLTAAVQSYLENNSIPIVIRTETSQETVGLSLAPDMSADGVDPAEMLANFHHLTDDEVRGLLTRMLEEEGM